MTWLMVMIMFVMRRIVLDIVQLQFWRRPIAADEIFGVNFKRATVANGLHGCSKLHDVTRHVIPFDNWKKLVFIIFVKYYSKKLIWTQVHSEWPRKSNNLASKVHYYHFIETNYLALWKFIAFLSVKPNKTDGENGKMQRAYALQGVFFVVFSSSPFYNMFESNFPKLIINHFNKRNGLVN